MGRFDGAAAIVTGGASGIGKALCEELGRQGARVVVADVDADGAERVAKAIVDSGGRAKGVRLDVSNCEDVKNLIEGTAAEHGRLDLLFNNAGIDIGGEFRDLELEHWRRLIAVNQWGVLYGTHAAYRLMVRQGSGHIVNTASMVGLFPLPMETAYVASKHAIVGLSLSLRAEAAALGVRVSAVCPGFVRSRFYEDSKHVHFDEKALIGEIPDFVYVSPERCARIILRGVRRNSALIKVGAAAHVLWLLYRLLPRTFVFGLQAYAWRLRRLRR